MINNKQFFSGSSTDNGVFVIYVALASIILGHVLTKMLKMPGVHYMCFLFLLIVGMSVRDLKLFKKIILSPSPFIWLVWVIYAFINWKSTGLHYYDNDYYFIITHFILPIGTLWIVIYAGMRDLNRTSKVIMYLLAIYVLIGIVFQDSGTGEDSTWEGRGGAELGNSLALNGVCLVFFACFCEAKKCISKRTMYLLLLLALGGVLFSATRKALVGSLLIVVFYSLSYVDFKKPTNFIRFFFLLGLLFVVGFFVLNYTQVGNRFSDIETQSEKALFGYYNVPTFLNFLGDRALHYMLGWYLFLSNPITGVGLKNFIVLTNFPVVCHSEYMVQLCENGLIGFVLFIFFMLSLLRIPITNFNRHTKRVVFVSLGFLFCMLFLDLTAWTYEFPRYFAAYGIIIACFSEGKKNASKLLHHYKITKLSQRDE